MAVSSPATEQAPQKAKTVVFPKKWCGGGGRQPKALAQGGLSPKLKEGIGNEGLRKGSRSCYRRGEATMLFIIRLRSHFYRLEGQMGKIKE